MQEAYDALLLEVEKLAHSGADINAYVKIGDKNVKTSPEQMKDLAAGLFS